MYLFPFLHRNGDRDELGAEELCKSIYFQILIMDMTVLTITCNVFLALDNDHDSHLRADTDEVKKQ